MIRQAAIFASLAAIVLPVAAQADTTPVTFVRDGTTYVYAIEEHKDFQVLKGTAGAVPFALVVRGGNVSGSFNGTPVRFPLSEVHRAPTAVEIAQR